jgi:hypothetical protein
MECALDPPLARLRLTKLFDLSTRFDHYALMAADVELDRSSFSLGSRQRAQLLSVAHAAKGKGPRSRM